MGYTNSKKRLVFDSFINFLVNTNIDQYLIQLLIELTSSTSPQTSSSSRPPAAPGVSSATFSIDSKLRLVNEIESYTYLDPLLYQPFFDTIVIAKILVPTVKSIKLNELLRRELFS
jgi:hypothetical protein